MGGWVVGWWWVGGTTVVLTQQTLSVGRCLGLQCRHHKAPQPLPGQRHGVCSRNAHRVTPVEWHAYSTTAGEPSRCHPVHGALLQWHLNGSSAPARQQGPARTFIAWPACVTKCVACCIQQQLYCCVHHQIHCCKSKSGAAIQECAHLHVTHSMAHHSPPSCASRPLLSWAPRAQAGGQQG